MVVDRLLQFENPIGRTLGRVLGLLGGVPAIQGKRDLFPGSTGFAAADSADRIGGGLHRFGNRIGLRRFERGNLNLIHGHHHELQSVQGTGPEETIHGEGLQSCPLALGFSHRFHVRADFLVV